MYGRNLHGTLFWDFSGKFQKCNSTMPTTMTHLVLVKPQYVATMTHLFLFKPHHIPTITNLVLLKPNHVIGRIFYYQEVVPTSQFIDGASSVLCNGHASRVGPRAGHVQDLSRKGRVRWWIATCETLSILCIKLYTFWAPCGQYLPGDRREEA